MKSTFFTLVLVMLNSGSALAGILNTTPSAKSLEGVMLAQQGVVTANGSEIQVTSLGAGIRTKKVAIVNVKVYVAELFASDASKFQYDENEALNSLDKSQVSAIRLTFLRNVDAPTVQTSFGEALKANQIDMQEPSLAAFLQAVATGGDAISGKTFTIVSAKNADLTETLTYEDAAGKVSVVQGPQGLGHAIMSIWLGKSSDSGVAALKKQILQGTPK